jgi:hypothetical protein
LNGRTSLGQLSVVSDASATASQQLGWQSAGAVVEVSPRLGSQRPSSALG